MKIDGDIDLVKELEKYSDEVAEEIGNLAEDSGREAMSTLKSTSPKRTGKYRKSWKIKIERNKSFVNVKVYNTQSGLPHLLEYGHATRNGGRTRAIPHISPVEKDVKDKFLKGVEKILEGK